MACFGPDEMWEDHRRGVTATGRDYGPGVEHFSEEGRVRRLRYLEKKAKEKEKKGEWVATVEQRRCLTQAMEVGLDRTLKVIAVSAGVEPKELVRWLDEDKRFANAWREIGERMLGISRPVIYSALIQRAISGDMGAIKLAFEMTKDYVPGMKVSGEVKVSLSDLLIQAHERMIEGEGREVSGDESRRVSGGSAACESSSMVQVEGRG